MALDFIFSRRRERRTQPKDEFDFLIDRIEKFAPRNHKSDRELYYYNYRMMKQYLKPLTGLLETVVQKKRVDQEDVVFIRELFRRLKDFYDLRSKLSQDEALNDMGLQKRFLDLLVFFYNVKDLTWTDVRRLLK